MEGFEKLRVMVESDEPKPSQEEITSEEIIIALKNMKGKEVTEDCNKTNYVRFYAETAHRE